MGETLVENLRGGLRRGAIEAVDLRGFGEKRVEGLIELFRENDQEPRERTETVVKIALDATLKEAVGGLRKPSAAILLARLESALKEHEANFPGEHDIHFDDARPFYQRRAVLRTLAAYIKRQQVGDAVGQR